MDRHPDLWQKLSNRKRCVVAAVFCLFLVPVPAHADAAAGRQAYEKGDYRRAMAEWQAAADHNDPESEFGIGSLYEFGAGDLKQDYTRAAYWYRKAAQQGNTEAEYRLALLFSAGGDNFDIDLAEAYKWATIVKLKVFGEHLLQILRAISIVA
jgi:Sel1 repeat